MNKQTEFPLEIVNLTLFPAVRPETTKTGNDLKNRWLIKFLYSKDGMNLEGSLWHDTNIPLRSNLDVAKGLILHRLNLNA